MKPKEYIVLKNCIDKGIEQGWNRAHKHLENPTPIQVQNDIGLAIMNEISEYFIFEEDK